MEKNRFPVSDHCNGSRFFNPQGSTIKTFKDILKWQLNKKPNLWPKSVENKFTPELPSVIQTGELYLTFINHETFLLQLQGLNILTDPVFSERASPFSWIGPKRVRPPGMKLGQLPKIDIVLVSHNHYDHMDSQSLKELNQLFQPQFLVPLGNSGYLKNLGIENVIEKDWNENIQIKNVTIHLQPAFHWSRRTSSDTNQALWCSFVIESNFGKIYFAGDTGYQNHFKQIFNRFGSMDLTLLPIGAYEPRWFMKESHMNPEDAVKAHLDLQSKTSIAMHFGTFKLTDENFDEPVQDLETAKKKMNVFNFLIMDEGETRKFKAN